MNVSLTHLIGYDVELADWLLKNPISTLPLVEKAAEMMLLSQLKTNDHKSIQVVLKSDQQYIPLRQLHAHEVNKLIKVAGIVISASNVRAKAVAVHVKCKTCGHVLNLPIKNAFGGASLPKKCQSNIGNNSEIASANPIAMENCGIDPYVIVADKSTYVDQQTLKLQENPEVVPTGEMPRNILLSLDRNLVDRVSPGTRVSITGVSCVFHNKKQGTGGTNIRTPYLRVVGIEVDEEGAGRAGVVFTPAEEATIHEMARDPKIYEKLSYSIAPSIYGDYTENIKKALACLLVGGTRKQLPDQLILRGDINVLLLGDPSTAKSQFLKFVEKVAPVGVYTSGKGSSAAGLTASVIRDAKGDFYLEGGAMVLADGGVVCIDEFDKMRESDRVAIHEAMEQQTISIAKAGITTILNSRASVLAAANPVFGRYDDMRSASENIDLMTTILSRFDMIFIVRDIQDEARDRHLAQHVIRVHTNSLSKKGQDEHAHAAEVEPGMMKKFVTYVRNRCAPRLSVEASKALEDFYVNIRDDLRSKSNLNGNNESEEETAIPVTVRQLEALIRIAESLAKMSLSIEATPEHVQEAIRLFRVSTLNAAKEGGTQGLFQSFHANAAEVENAINRSLRIGAKTDTSALYSRLESQGHNPNSIQRAIRAMVQKGLLQQTNQYKFVSRLR